MKTSALDHAIALARTIHTGQTDKAGAPYIDHPLRVMEQLRTEGETAMIAAVLHDTIEDGGATPEQLRAAGFPEAAIAAVQTVSKQPGEHGTDAAYERFIERIASNGTRLAILVKLADLADNMDLSRLGHAPTENDLARQEKYARAHTRLQGALTAAAKS